MRAHIREKCGNAKLQTGGQQDANGDSLNVLQNYELQPTGELKSDGTPKFQSETHTYKATARKGPASKYWEDSSSGMYVIWDAVVSEVHHRITHERHGTVVQTTE